MVLAPRRQPRSDRRLGPAHRRADGAAQAPGVDHRYIPLLVTAPGIGWINAYTIASEIGDIGRFSSPAKLCGYTGLCPRVRQSGGVDARGPISKHGPKYLRWALFEAALNACKHPATPSATRTPSAASSVLFVRAWGRHWLIGTTDTPWDLDRDHPSATRADIEYLLRNVNRVLESPLRHEDVQACSPACARCSAADRT